MTCKVWHAKFDFFFCLSPSQLACLAIEGVVLCRAGAIVDVRSVYSQGVGVYCCSRCRYPSALCAYREFIFKIQRGVVPLIRCGSRGCEWLVYQSLILRLSSFVDQSITSFSCLTFSLFSQF